ncbi:ATP-binding protein [Wenjunlia tyrosinilytica]|uniref:histidine kinase n=1 Tax=Wenjunlia tyrosinilytica TaxID=1544741 RepID=A0A917ZT66_9ACTN|nr:ATP-binding protein [Wenjunlia tyrosinilytica]GGO90734.1 sensor histidine kinase [Wenjunlia tyrosinilytica]
MTQQIPEVLFWCVVAALLTTAVLLLRQRGLTANAVKRNALLEGSLRARDEEARHLVEVRLPALANSMHQPVPVPGLLDERLTGTAYAQNLHRVMEQFAGAAEKAQARADQSAKSALKAAMRTLQGLANEQQLSISDMQDRHDHPDVLRDLLEIDHANSQFGRRAQAIAVLCGSWPGRQRAASPLTDVVRGAKSRIRDYRRVQVRTQIDVAVVSRAVEPVVLAVAELLDNAARHSQPNTTVEVNLQPAHNGACVVIDDAGVGMDGQEAQQAGTLLSGRRRVDINRLGDPPRFGFAVIGVLAQRYGFKVSVDTRSPYGGVRAVLFLPSALLTHVDLDEPALPAGSVPSVPSVAPARSVPVAQPEARPVPIAEPLPDHAPAGGRARAAQPSAPDRPATEPDSFADPDRFTDPDRFAEPPTRAHAHPQSESETAGGLPKRRRRRPVADPQASPAAGDRPADPPAERSVHETAQRMGAFARGTRSGRAAAHDDEGNPLS